METANDKLPLQEVSAEQLQAIKSAVLRSRSHAVHLVNRELLSLYFALGGFICTHSRSERWGNGAVQQISDWLKKQFPGGRGFSVSNLKNMRQFYEEWAEVLNCKYETNKLPEVQTEAIDEEILLKPIRQFETGELNKYAFMQIPFTAHMHIIFSCKNIQERLFYINQTAQNNWNIDTLKYHIKSNLYGNQHNMPNNFLQTIPDSAQAHKALCMFRDKYLLDFINIDDYAAQNEDIDEKVIEREIVANIKNFIMMFGKGFCYISSQYRIEVGDNEAFIDLLFYNRNLHAMVAVELKRGKFKPSYVGQLNYYLSVLDEKERREGENPSIGIILCHEMDKTVVEYAIRGINSPMGVATWQTADETRTELQRVLPDFSKMSELL